MTKIVSSLLIPFMRRPIAAAGLGILVCMTAAAILAPILAPYDPSKIEPIVRLLPHRHAAMHASSITGHKAAWLIIA